MKNIARLIFGSLLLTLSSGTLFAQSASEILTATGISHGLCVRVGTTDGALETSLSGDGNLLVYGLALPSVDVKAVRETISNAGLGGVVSIDQAASFTKLPFANNLVNLLIVDRDALGATAPSIQEIERVVSPFGAYYVKQGGTWTVTKVPLKAGMAEWGQNFGTETNNNQVNDTLVDVPNSIQWLADVDAASASKPRSGFRLSNGMTFYFSMVNNAAANKDEVYLVCRNATNGTLIWRKPATANDVFTNKQVPILFYNGVIYTYLSKTGFMVALDGRTGNTIRTFTNAGKPKSDDLPNMVASNGKIYLTADKSLWALDTNGTLDWKRTFTKFVGLPSVDKTNNRVYVATASSGYKVDRDVELKGVDSLHCFNTANGNFIWKSRVRQKNTTNVTLSQLIVAENKLFYVKSGGIFMSDDHFYVWGAKNLATGDSIWQREIKKNSVQRLEATVLNGKLYPMSGGYDVIDANNGAYLQRINGGNLRCPASTATSKRLLVGFSLFGDPANNRITRRDITRSECGTLSYPSYGLLHYTTNRCQCTQGLRGASALSSEPIGAEWPLNQRLTKYITLSGSDTLKPAIWPRPNEWPSFLANAERTSSNQSQVTTLANPQLGWTIQPATPYYSKTTRVYQDWLGSDKHVGVVTSPVIADSILVVSVQEENKIVAYDAINGGAPKWNFISGGRLLGPPTLYNGLCIFGSGDGYVYCLKLKTGALVWKFFAARNDKKVVVHGHVETPWSMPTSLLIKDNKVIVNAGYTPDSDGGVYLWALNPFSGKVIWKNLIDRPRRWYNYSENMHDESHFTATFLQGVNNTKLVNSLLYCDKDKVSFNNMRNFKLSDGTFTTDPMDNQINYIERDPLKRNLMANWSMFYYTDNSMKAKVKGFNASSNYGRFAYLPDSVVVGSRTTTGISCESPDAICFEKDVARVNSTNSLIYAGKNMVMCVEGTRSSVFNTVSGIVYIYDILTGNRVATLNLPSTVVSNGIVAAYGKLYLTCEDGKIYCYGTGAGEKPFAVAGNDQVKSDVGLDGTESFFLDGSQSYAPYDSLVSYEWSQNGTVLGTGKKTNLELAPGQHTVILKVTSSQGLSATDTVKLFLSASYAPGAFRYLKLNMKTGSTYGQETGINELYFYSGGVGYPQALDPKFSNTQLTIGNIKYSRSPLRLISYLVDGGGANRIFDKTLGTSASLRGDDVILDLTNAYALYPDSVLLNIKPTGGGPYGNFGITGDSIYLFGSNDQTTAINTIQWKKIAAYKNQIGEPTTGGSFWLVNKVLARPTNAPSPLTASVNGQKVTLNWTDANTNELGFSLERKIAGGQWVQVGNLAANATSFIDSSVVSGGTYTYKVCAYAGANISPYSNTVDVTIGFFISAPTNLTGLSTSIISLQWADNATNEDGYYIERKSANGTFAVIATRPANTTQYDDNTILPDSVYTYRVRAYFGAVLTSYSNEVVVNAPLSVALAPTNLTALALPGLLEVKLNWVDNAFNEDGYDIYYKAITDPNFVLTKTVVPNAVSTTLNNAPNPRFNPNTTYVFYVVATNSSGNSIQSNYDTVTTGVVSVERMVIQRHEYKVFPVPTNKNIIVEMPKLNEKLEISLIDMQGRTVYKSMESGNFDINVRGMAAGEYTLKMASLKLGISTTTLVVVSK